MITISKQVIFFISLGEGGDLKKDEETKIYNLEYAQYFFLSWNFILCKI